MPWIKPPRHPNRSAAMVTCKATNNAMTEICRMVTVVQDPASWKVDSPAWANRASASHFRKAAATVSWIPLNNAMTATCKTAMAAPPFVQRKPALPVKAHRPFATHPQLAAMEK